MAKITKHTVTEVSFSLALAAPVSFMTCSREEFANKNDFKGLSNIFNIKSQFSAMVPSHLT